MRIGLSVVAILLAFPLYTNAEVFLSEIMYDLDGSDSGREWVEIYNAGSDAVDLSSWKFFEADTNHKLKVSQGNAVLPPSGYAIIADNATTFLDEHSSFSGTVFDSSFSLKNTGEFIALRDSDLNDVDSVSYSSDWGAKGDGNSLQRVNDEWVAASPTVGFGSFDEEGDPPAEGSGDVDDTPTTKQAPKEFITVNIGPDREVVVGAAEFFEAEAYKKDGSTHPYVSYRWNFGNGSVKEGKKVLHQYNYPGKYIVWVSGTGADRLSATDRITVEAKSVNLYISLVDNNSIQLFNDSTRELNLSLWSLRANGQHFLFPQNTILAPSSRVTFANTVTGLQTEGASDVALIYPNGMIAHAYGTSPQYNATVSSGRPWGVQEISPILKKENNTNATGGITEDLKIPPENTQLASARSAGGSVDSNLYPWLLTLIGLLTFAIVFVLMLDKKTETVESGKGEKTKLKANDFKIIED